ncbi:MAG: PAS domain S-box protein [Chloroflexi bacterium]|nr:PAS domain S-box protein [Chloroflexota bacterium]
MMDLLNVINTPILVTSAQGRLHFANAAAQERYQLPDDLELGSSSCTLVLTTRSGLPRVTSWDCQTDGNYTYWTEQTADPVHVASDTLLNTIAEGVVIHDHTGAIIMCNRSAERILGQNRDQILGRTPIDPDWQTVHPDGTPFPGEEHPAAVSLRTGDAQRQVPMGVHKPDGSLAWIMINATPVIEPGEAEPHSVVVSFAEITQVMLLEQRYRQYFEDHAAVKLLIDPETLAILDGNKAACSFYGYTHSELLALSIADINVLSPTRLKHRLDQARSKERTRFEFRHRLASGELRDVEVFSIPLAIDGRPVLHSIVHDISARRRVELALREAEERFRRVAETARDAIITSTQDGQIIFWNEAASDLFGYTEEEVLGKSISLIVPVARRAEHAAYMQRLSGKSDPDVRGHTIEVDARTKSGAAIPVEISLSSWHVNNSTFMTAIIRDLSTRREAEQQRIELALQREKAVMLASFIRDSSHEFRSPLAVIMTNSYMLRDDPDGAKRAHRLTQIDEAARSMSALIDSMLEIVELDQRELDRRAGVDLNSIVQMVVADLGPLAEEAGSSLTLETDSALPRIDGDPTRLFSALYHLVHNAVRFTAAGGTVRVQTACEDDTILFTVADTGPGIPEDIQPHIFDRFFRGDEAHTTRGFGLGLPIARQVIEMHGGSLTFASQPGRGSTFWVRLPY